ncbi:hypothetical protein ACS0TY_014533 [Phlomoides rotata]
MLLHELISGTRWSRYDAALTLVHNNLYTDVCGCSGMQIEPNTTTNMFYTNIFNLLLYRDPSPIRYIENRDFSSNSSSSGSQGFGRTHDVMPTGKHEATIVWLHALGEDGYMFLKGGSHIWNADHRFNISLLPMEYPSLIGAFVKLNWQDADIAINWAGVLHHERSVGVLLC